MEDFVTMAQAMGIVIVVWAISIAVVCVGLVVAVTLKERWAKRKALRQ